MEQREPEQAEREPEQIEREIEETREEMGETVEALAEKADVKAQAQEKVEDVKEQARGRVEDVKEQAREKVADARATLSGRRDELGARAGQAGPGSFDPGQAAAVARERPMPVAFGAFLAGFLLGRLTSR